MNCTSSRAGFAATCPTWPSLRATWRSAILMALLGEPSTQKGAGFVKSSSASGAARFHDIVIILQQVQCECAKWVHGEGEGGGRELIRFFVALLLSSLFDLRGDGMTGMRVGARASFLTGVHIVFASAMCTCACACACARLHLFLLKLKLMCGKQRRQQQHGTISRPPRATKVRRFLMRCTDQSPSVLRPKLLAPLVVCSRLFSRCFGPQV